MVATALQAPSDNLDPATFSRFAEFIYDYSGIKMPLNKITMLEGRLRRRLRATGLTNFDEYCTYLFGEGADSELVHFIDVVTTNKTDFFREPKHFEVLQHRVLPDLVSQGHRDIRAWSSACSTGAEPYTMAMLLEEAVTRREIDNYTILATDLSSDVLQQARRGVYEAQFLAPVPKDLAARYLMLPVAKDRTERRIIPKLRRRIGFGRLNLMDNAYAVGDAMHMIFCRNVLIYFDKKTQYGVLRRLCDCLVPGGYLFIGHSESVAGMDLPVRQIANTVFVKV
jgi:Methylase of chemotaxis methyl-accepting proteins